MAVFHGSQINDAATGTAFDLDETSQSGGNTADAFRVGAILCNRAHVRDLRIYGSPTQLIGCEISRLANS